VSLWASLAFAVVVVVVSATETYIGDCSGQTGYRPEVGSMEVLPAVVLVVGILLILVAAGVRGNRPIARFVAVGLFVCVLSVVSFFEVESNIGHHLCD
jgi:hypothetical protein